MGALYHIWEQPAIEGDGTEDYLREITGTHFVTDDLDLMLYNDDCRTFKTIRNVITEARAKARAELLGPAPPPRPGRRHPKSATRGDVQWQIGILRAIAGRHADQALHALKAGTDDQDHHRGFGARRRGLCLPVSALR